MNIQDLNFDNIMKESENKINFINSETSTGRYATVSTNKDEVFAGLIVKIDGTVVHLRNARWVERVNGILRTTPGQYRPKEGGFEIVIFNADSLLFQ